MRIIFILFALCGFVSMKAQHAQEKAVTIKSFVNEHGYRFTANNTQHTFQLKVDRPLKEGRLTITDAKGTIVWQVVITGTGIINGSSRVFKQGLYKVEISDQGIAVYESSLSVN